MGSVHGVRVLDPFMGSESLIQIHAEQIKDSAIKGT